MADEVSHTSKPQNPSKFFSHFMYKSTIVTVFLVLLPFFPSLAPDFINQTLHARSWELIQLIFVGIAVSYGLFSKKNDDTEKDHHHHHHASSKLDNAQSYVSKLLQVSSVFDDESENHSTVIEENKIQTSNSQYYRGEPLVLVAKESPFGGEENDTTVITSEISQKPLLLPVRSLKQRLPEPNEVDLVDEGGRNGSVNRSKRFANSNSRKSRIGVLNVQKSEEDLDENLVLRSPIPWRSRSGRMEVRENGENPNLEDQDFDIFESLRSSRPNSSSKNLSPSPSFSSESQAKSSEDVLVMKKTFSSAPPPPPPPPPSLRKSVLIKSNSVTTNNNEVSTDKILRRSVRSVPKEELIDSRTQNDGLAKSVRRLRSSSELGMPAEKNSVDYEPKYVEKKGYIDKMVNERVPNESTQTYAKFHKKETNGLVEKVAMETSDDDDSEVESEDDYFEGSSNNGEAAINNNNNNSLNNDVGRDVDKKADEFIAKFREQIRLQRIESIRRSTEQRAGKTFR